MKTVLAIQVQSLVWMHSKHRNYALAAASTSKDLNHSFCCPHFSLVHCGHRRPSWGETV